MGRICFLSIFFMFYLYLYVKKQYLCIAIGSLGRVIKRESGKVLSCPAAVSRLFAPKYNVTDLFGKTFGNERQARRPAYCSNSMEIPWGWTPLEIQVETKNNVMKQTLHLLVVVFCMLFCCPCYTWAQVDTLIHADKQLQNVEVIGQRQLQRLSSASPLQQLTQKDIKVQGITDIADALHRLPGITLRDYGGAGGMKTVSVRGFGAQHTTVIYDGMALSDCQSGQIDVSRYSLDNVENISLIVGDPDDIFIPAREVSTAASLKIQTLQMPDDDLKAHLTAQMRVGSFGYINPFFRLNKNISEKFGIQALGEYIYAENDYPYTLRNVTLVTREKRNNSRMNSGHGEISFAWKPTARTQALGKIYYYDNDRQLPGIVHYYTNSNEETQHDRNFFGQLSLRSSLSDQFSFQWKGKYNWASTSYRDPNYPDGVMDQDYWQREYYTTASLLYRPTDNLSFDYSADYSYNNLNSSEKADTKPFRHTVLQSLSAKYQTGRLKLLARALYTLSFNDAKLGDGGKNAHKLSPSLSLSYQLLDTPTLYVRASYKNIFRMPNFTELYFRHYGSKELNPENTNQFNVGFTWKQAYSSTGSFTLTADGYLNHVDDKIVAVPTSMFMWTNINVGKVKVLGTDITLNIRQKIAKDQQITLAGNFTYQNVEDRTLKGGKLYGLQIAYTPHQSGSFSLGYENPWVNLTFHGTGVSRRWANNNHYPETDLSGYMEFGLTAYRTFKFGDNQLEIRGDLKNILDKQYEIVGHYPMPGRSWQASILWKF